jgi:hypothetical protein
MKKRLDCTSLPTLTITKPMASHSFINNKYSLRKTGNAQNKKNAINGPCDDFGGLLF